MPQDLWTAMDRYICDRLLPEDAALEAALADCSAAGLPPIAVTPAQGKLLELLVRIQGARRILELGTLGGYSTIWLARGLPSDGSIVTLELDPHHAEVAEVNLERAGVREMVQVRVGAALQTLPELHAEGAGPFDLIFIDADKVNYPGYLEWSLKLARPGSVIIGDNVVREGVILDPDGYDPRLGEGGVQEVRRFYDLLAAEPRVSATAVQTVGEKGHDGFVIALVGDGGDHKTP
jgi:predicted O-methyltransferase YrrM